MSTRKFKCPSCNKDQIHTFDAIPAEGQLWTCPDCEKRHNAQHIHAFTMPPPPAPSPEKVSELNALSAASNYPDAKLLTSLVHWLHHRSKEWSEAVERALRELDKIHAGKSKE